MISGEKVIDGRFELRARLGSGGMGTVWRAFDLALQREVALKEVRLAEAEGSQQDPEVADMLRERVLREARALARLDHPNVVTIHHIVDLPNMPHPWLVMELVRGRSLADRLADGPLPPAEAAAIGRGILGALRAAHEAGICHRDVKPANVLLRTDGTAVLTDFGIAVLEEASRVTATGGLVGSPEYIAPERLHGQEGNPASDFWSLGLLLYVAVEGQNPLRRPTAAATLAAVMTAQIAPARRAGPLEPVLQGLLTRDPAARPTASQLDQMLAQAANSSSFHAPGPALPPPPAYPGAGPGTNPTAGPGTNPTGGPGTNPGGGGTNPGFGPGMNPGPRMTPNPFPVPGANPTGAVQRRRRTGVLVAAAVAVPAVGAIAVLLVAMIVVLPLFDRGSGEDTVDNGDPSGAAPADGGRGSTKAGGGGAAEPKTLLTPAAIRSVIKKFEAASGSKAFAQFTVYEDRASADAPVKGRNGAFDNYTYEKGADVAVRSRPSIAITTGNAKVNLNTFDWDALPALMRRAARTLKVPKPTSRYIIVRSSWAFNGDKPTMLLYYTDEYDGGYMAVNTQGRVISSYPAKS